MADRRRDEARMEVSYRRSRKKRQIYNPPRLRHECSMDRYNYRHSRYQPIHGSTTRANYRDSRRRERVFRGMERRQVDPPGRRLDRRNQMSGYHRPQRYGAIFMRTQKECMMTEQRSTDPDFSLKTDSLKLRTTSVM